MNVALDRTWSREDLQTLLTCCTVDAAARLEEVCRAQSSSTTSDLLLTDTLHADERIHFAATRLGLGAKKLRHFAADCAVYLARLADGEILDMLRLAECISVLRAAIDTPTRANVSEMRRESAKTFLLAHDHHRELPCPSRRFFACELAMVAKIATGLLRKRRGPRDKDWICPEFSAGHSASICSRRCAREFARVHAFERAAHAANEALQEALTLNPVSAPDVADLRQDLITWAALFAQYYCQHRREGHSMIEACDDADYWCGTFFYTDTELLENVADDAVEPLKPVFRAARDAAVQASGRAYEDGLRETYAVLASRMNEYVFGNPVPWNLGE